MSNSFVNLNILDCNRLSSEEAKAGNNQNPALWHNKIGSGVIINPGDKIQINQSFVSEDGAGDSVIEFGGDSLNKQHTIKYLSASYQNACSTIPQGFERITYTEVSETLNLFDNKASIVINYYKNANGENYIQLPRKFTCLDSIVNSSNRNVNKELWLASENSSNLGFMGAGGNYGTSGGLPFHQVPYFDRNSRDYFYCEADYYYSPNKFRSESASNTGLEDFFKLRNDNANYTIYVKTDNYYIAFGGEGNASGAVNASNIITVKNIRGDIVAGQQIVWGAGPAEAIFVVSFTKATSIVIASANVVISADVEILFQPFNQLYPGADYHTQQISNIEYIKYSEKVDLEIKKGFNSPSNIANDITNQLQQTEGDLSRIYYDRFKNQPNFTPQQAISAYLESKTYKIFNAQNIKDTTDLSYSAWNASIDLKPEQNVINYINAHGVIGIKRPDLYDYGRKLNASLSADKSITSLNNGICIFGDLVDTDTQITTSLLWTDSNLQLLRDLFIIQGRYPELFEQPYNDYGNGATARGQISVNTNRYLHINGYKHRAGTPTPPATKTDPIPELGTDDINGSGSFFNFVEANYISFPLYFYYNELQKDNGPDTATGTAGDLVYGFAMKSASNNIDYISFYTGGPIGGYPPPKQYFQYNSSYTGGGNKIESGTLLGWDTHWTAHSTCVIGLCDGWTDEQYNSTKISGSSTVATQPEYTSFWSNGLNATWQDASALAQSPASFTEQLKKVYVGANEPLLNFDTVSGRFNISQLHTPEYVGNDIRAGATPTSDTELTIPINPDADNKVYKINKRITNTNWTTAMLPFSSNYIQSASGPLKTDPEYDLALMNPNFNPYQIFDSKSGITINDFGVSQDAWNDSLWGILGFTYEQFNSSISKGNTYTSRITEGNVKSLNFATTNANITSAQTIQFLTNPWGVPIFNQQVPITYYWDGKDRVLANNQLAIGSRENVPIQNYPPITQVQDSILLTALNLPRKMLKPYYCIRSDIIDEAHYLGGQDSGIPLPVVGIVNKINGYGDFYFSEESNLIFTATKRKVITSITTSIHYPDQTFANVSPESAIIYKITKIQPAVSNVLQEIQQQQSQAKKKGSK